MCDGTRLLRSQRQEELAVRARGLVRGENELEVDQYGREGQLARSEGR